MRYTLITAALVGAAFAGPIEKRQDFDWDAIDAMDPVPTPDIPIVSAAAAQTTVSYAPAVAASSVSSAILADPTDTSLKVKRAIDNSGCAASAVPSSSDTDSAFLANPTQTDAAKAASTPTGYTQSFSNLQGSSNAYGYMGYSLLTSYDTATCATRCNKIKGCSAFNVYYERDPSIDPTTTCTNPSSVTVIKCVYWGGALDASTAVNMGQYRRDFHVVISGSNGYTSNSIATPAGYTGPVYYGTAAINAPNDCNGANTYLTVKTFNSGPFDAGQCAAACSAESDYRRTHPNADGTFQTCQFFNTYILYNNTVPTGQICSLYNETWPATFATNAGQYRGTDKFTVNYSYGFSNTTANADKPIGCKNPTKPS